MPLTLNIDIVERDLDGLAQRVGAVVAFWRQEGDERVLSPAAQAIDALTDGQVSRALGRAKGDRAETTTLTAPHGMAADAAVLVCLGTKTPSGDLARKFGGDLARGLNGLGLETARVETDDIAADAVAEMALGLMLKTYRFDLRKSEAEPPKLKRVELAAADASAAGAAWAGLRGVADGVSLTRDLVNEPANVLSPETFAERLKAMAADGLQVDVFGEMELEEIGMRALLAVGQGSRRDSKVVVMRWMGAPDPKSPPIAYVGKGVVFDTGGISLKPPAGMEEMTMDMGGAGVVSGVMLALAKKKAPVNVVGVVGLVENMPDGDAQRPGDIVTALSGTTIEVINTDAEGRLVLADVLWWTQETFKPRAMVDLATLTGAMIIALGHSKAGYFANDDALAQALEAAAKTEGEGLWRLPLGRDYDKQIKSRLADIKNTGGRAAGSITAAQFLQRFVNDDTPWAHIDIAGVCLPKEEGSLAPKGPSGWGVTSLVRLAETSFAENAFAENAFAEKPES